MRLLRLIAAVCFCCLVLCAGAKEREVSGAVYTDPTEGPIFPGSVVTGIPAFMERNLKYPLEAWNSSKLRDVAVECVICKDGTMADVKLLNKDIHPTLREEILRVLGKMQWIPATKDGKKVNVKYNMTIPLVEPGRNALEGAPLPYGLGKVARDGEMYVKRWNKDNPRYDTKAEEEYEVVDEAWRLFPERSVISMASGRMLAAAGKYEECAARMDSALTAYQRLNPLSEEDRLSKIAKPMRMGFNGRNELGMAILRAMAYDLSGNEEADNAYGYAVSLADGRIVDGDIKAIPSRWEQEDIQQRIERMQSDMTREFLYGGSFDKYTPNWTKVTRNYSIAELSESLACWIKKKDIGNAQVHQLAALIDELKDEMRNGYLSKGESLNLFGAKAFAIWMRDGDSGFDEYLASIRATKPSDDLLKYLAKLEKNKKVNAAKLSDRRAVLESLVCQMAPESADVAAVKEFYDRRKAAEKVFPLRWLME